MPCGSSTIRLVRRHSPWQGILRGLDYTVHALPSQVTSQRDGPRSIEEFLTHSIVQQAVAASTLNQALSALLLRSRDVLNMLLHASCAKKPKPLPAVLSNERLLAESAVPHKVSPEFHASSMGVSSSSSVPFLSLLMPSASRWLSCPARRDGPLVALMTIHSDVLAPMSSTVSHSKITTWPCASRSDISSPKLFSGMEHSRLMIVGCCWAAITPVSANRFLHDHAASIRGD
jgi:hypothetical protein